MLRQEILWLLKEKYDGEKSQAFFADCERLKAGEPLAYLIGSIPFLDTTIYLDSKPLIPRPETEFWVHEFIQKHQSPALTKHPQRIFPERGPAETKQVTGVGKRLKYFCFQTFKNVSNFVKTLNQKLSQARIKFSAQPFRRRFPQGLFQPQVQGQRHTMKWYHHLWTNLVSKRLDLGGFGWGKPGTRESVLPEDTATYKILDLCAGSGCIGVAVGQALPVARVDFSEINARHLPTIEKNCRENGLSSQQYTVIESDLFERITDTYDIILTNPPYIDPALDRTEASVKAHEPEEALYGGAAGMHYIEAIIATAPRHLHPGGELWIEHEPEQSNAIKAVAATYNFTTHTHRDQYDVERYSVLVLQ